MITMMNNKTKSNYSRSFEDFTRFKLDFDDLTTGIVDARTNYEPLLTTVHSVVNSDNVTRL